MYLDSGLDLESKRQRIEKLQQIFDVIASQNTEILEFESAKMPRNVDVVQTRSQQHTMDAIYYNEKAAAISVLTAGDGITLGCYRYQSPCTVIHNDGSALVAQKDEILVDNFLDQVNLYYGERRVTDEIQLRAHFNQNHHVNEESKGIKFKRWSEGPIYVITLRKIVRNGLIRYFWLPTSVTSISQRDYHFVAPGRFSAAEADRGY